jgi:3-methyladenine DNA glycosylase AlkD
MPGIHQLRELMEAAGNPADGAIQQRYHKSDLAFFGLKAAQQRAIVREVFPPRQPLSRDEHLPVIRQLWASSYFDERVAGLLLLGRMAPLLGVDDLVEIRAMTGDCEGWALLDGLACTVLGPLVLAEGAPAYREIRGWSDDPWMWTRRAAILVHVIPARRARLEEEFAWPTFEERLHEREFFIRKAVGWALRECSKKYPEEVFAFLERVVDRASGLTRREGSRRLPEELQAKLRR